MFKKLRNLYHQYKAYVRVDLVMYAIMILLIILYFIYTVVVGNVVGQKSETKTTDNFRIKISHVDK